MLRKALLVGLVSAALVGTTFQATAERSEKNSPMGGAQSGHSNQQGMGAGMGMDMDMDGQRISGYQMMTPEERETHREKLRNMDSMEERQAYREEHHKMMQERARAEGEMIENLPPTAAGKPDSKSKMNKATKGGSDDGAGSY